MKSHPCRRTFHLGFWSNHSKNSTDTPTDTSFWCPNRSIISWLMMIFSQDCHSHRTGGWENFNRKSPSNLMVRTHGFPVKMFHDVPLSQGSFGCIHEEPWPRDRFLANENRSSGSGKWSYHIESLYYIYIYIFFDTQQYYRYVLYHNTLIDHYC